MGVSDTRGVTIDGKPAEMMLDLRVPPGGRKVAEDALRQIAEDSRVRLTIVELP